MVSFDRNCTISTNECLRNAGQVVSSLLIGKVELPNTRYNIPGDLKRQCKNGSETLQWFYEIHFVRDIIASRDGVCSQRLRDLDAEEVELALALTGLNMDHKHVAETHDLLVLLSQQDSLADDDGQRKVDSD